MPADPVRTMIKQAEERMRAVVDATQRDFAQIRTSRPTPALLDRVMVDYYGSMVPVKQVGTISAPDPRQLVISVWDPQLVPAVRKALQASDLRVNPVVEGNVVRVPLPPLTEERRKELVKLVGRKTEEGKVAVRNARRDTVEALRKMEKAHEISEDDLRRFQERVQELTDTHIEELDDLYEAKERELMEI